MMEQSYNSEPMTKEDFLSQGINLYREECYNEAIHAYEQAIKLDPNYALAFYGKGLALGRFWYGQHKDEEALRAFEHAIQLSPGYWRSHVGRGNILCSLRRYDEALISYNEAIRLNPYHALSYYAKGRILFHLNKSGEAFTAFEQAIHLTLDDPSICSDQMFWLACDGFTDEALAVYDKLLSAKPEFVDAYIGKARIYRIFTDDRIGALDAYNQAISVDRNYVKPYQYKAAQLFDNKLYGLAADVYDRIIQLVPGNPTIYFWRGACLLEMKRYEKALADFEQVLQLNAAECDILFLYFKGKALCRCGRYKEALADFKNALPSYCYGASSIMGSPYYDNSFSYGDKIPDILSINIYGEMRKLLMDSQNGQELLAELEDCYNQSEKEFDSRFAIVDDTESEYAFLGIQVPREDALRYDED